ncbi:MAG TPA: TetR/AcrR family transcriptional regulator [Longimicrobium sp.]|jgi:AcrR family transcriptional regulator
MTRSPALRRPVRPPPTEATFDRLVRTAREQFARDGFAGTSLDAVVAACGLTKGALYHHFGGKTELFTAVFEDEAARLADRVAGAMGAGEASWEGAFTGIRAFLRESQDPGVQRIMLLDGPSVLGWEGVREIEGEYGLALIKDTLAGLMAAGLIPDREVETLAHLLFGAMCEGAMLVARSDDPSAALTAVEAELKHLVSGLAARPA